MFRKSKTSIRSYKNRSGWRIRAPNVSSKDYYFMFFLLFQCGSFLKTEAYISSRRRRGEQESYQPVHQERIRDSVNNLTRKIEQLPILPRDITRLVH